MFIDVALCLLLQAGPLTAPLASPPDTVANRIVHPPTAASDNLGQCLVQWGEQLGPPLCHAVFRQESQEGSLSLEWQLLQVLTAMAHQKLTGVWQNLVLEAGAGWQQMHLLMAAEGF